MSTFELIKKAIDDQATAFEAFKKTNDERLDAVKKGNETKATELGETLKKIEVDVTKFSQLKASLETEITLQRERLEELESRAKSPGKTQEEKLRDEHKTTFIDWLRAKGQSVPIETKLAEIQKKTVNIGSVQAGGYAVPEEISRQIGLLELKYSPCRRLVKVVPAGSSDYKELVDLNNSTAGWVGETGARTATRTPQLRERAPTHGEIYAYPQATEWSLDDIFFNVETWLAESAARAFAVEEGDAVIRGNGSNKPTGMINSAPDTTADQASPFRDANKYEYVAALGTGSPVVAALTSDPIIDLQYKLNSSYRANATWVMNSPTTGAVRKLKDSTGQYLWQPSLQAGQPAMLLGSPLETWEQMDDIGTNKFPIAYGDFKQGYLLTERVGLRITRDNVTNVGFVRFYIRRREGGTVLNNDAIKFLKTTVA